MAYLTSGKATDDDPLKGHFNNHHLVHKISFQLRVTTNIRPWTGLYYTVSQTRLWMMLFLFQVWLPQHQVLAAVQHWLHVTPKGSAVATYSVVTLLVWDEVKQSRRLKYNHFCNSTVHFNAALLSSSYQ